MNAAVATAISRASVEELLDVESRAMLLQAGDAGDE
jgi:hypothetical protein